MLQRSRNMDQDADTGLLKSLRVKMRKLGGSSYPALQFPFTAFASSSMALLRTIDLTKLGESVASNVDPSKIISGNPQFRVWALDSSRDGEVRTGIFEGTPGENISIKGEYFEFCQILEGVVELTEDGQQPIIYRKGDSFVMKPGYKGVWRTIEKMRKLYVMVG
jgi:uncharacterized cupin superfamily protein